MKPYFYIALLSVILCLSCNDTELLELPEPIETAQEGVFYASYPSIDVSLTKSAGGETIIPETVIQKNITEQGSYIKITERLWVESNIGNSKQGAQTKSTWNDVVWDKDYDAIGVYTLKSSSVETYLNDKNPNHLVCYPFRAKDKDGLDLGSNYVFPTGNGHIANPYNYHNANRKVNAIPTKSSVDFFTHAADNEELHFYGYFPYQHQMAGINYALDPTSICQVLRANLHADNLLAMPYTFASTQTKDNIHQHDVMYSVSEDAKDASAPLSHDRNKYGNRYKKRHSTGKNDNVHMRFIHSFCRLQFTISAGAYRAGKTDPIKLSKLSIEGSKVYIDGSLNLIETKVNQGNAAFIERALDNGQETKGSEMYVDLRNQDLVISMIVQPTDKIETLNDFKIVCLIDGVEYSYSLAVGTELVKNHVYDVNLVLSPETKVIVASGGGSGITIYREPNESLGTLNSTGEMTASFADYMIIQPNGGWDIFKVLKNGAPMDTTFSSPPYRINIGRVENETTKYEIICIPDRWYSRPHDLITHFDGILNNGFAAGADAVQQIVPIWKDLSYNGNNGILYNFSLGGYSPLVNDTEPLSQNDVNGLITYQRSGWDTKGLRLDGKDDKVAFPGEINSSQYTISVYLCVAQALQTLWHRIISTGNEVTGQRDGFPGMVLNNQTSRLRLFGHGIDQEFCLGTDKNDNLYLGKTRGVDIVQVDYVYGEGGTNNLKLYIDGEHINTRSITYGVKSVPGTTLGGHPSNISRQLNATYYSFMVYGKALTEAEIKHNYVLNEERYGTTKTGGVAINPATKVVVERGATVNLYKTMGESSLGTITNTGEITTTSVNHILITPESGWRLYKVLDGKTQLAASNIDATTYPGQYLVNVGSRPINEANILKEYTVVCVPDVWYVSPENLTTHFDGLFNNGFADMGQRIVSTWKDIAYNGNDGTLADFDLSKWLPNVNDTETGTGAASFDRSGWDSKGLKFDGRNDKVRFPSSINKEEYTMSVYLCVTAATHLNDNVRIVSVGQTKGQTMFPGMYLNLRTTTIGLYGHGIDAPFGANTSGKDDLYFGGKTKGIDIVQVDYVYSRTAKTLKLYINGEHVGTRTGVSDVNAAGTMAAITALGGRANNVLDRQINATFYSFMLYDRVLSDTEIGENYQFNKQRFGTTKTSATVILP